MKLITLVLLLGLAPSAAQAATADEPALSVDAKAVTAACTNRVPVCDGIADDTCELQTLLDHSKPAMTVVEIPATPNGCRITGPLFVKSNTHIIQHGLLKLDYNWPPLVVEQRGMYTIVDNAHDVIIEGSGTLDGSDPVYTTGTPRCCMGGIVSGGPVVGATNANVSEITVRGLTVRNMPQWGIALTGATNVRIDGVTVHNMRGSSGVGLNSRDAIVTNSRFYNIMDTCFSLYRGVDDAIVSNIIANECQGSAISALSDWADCLPQPPLFSRHMVLNNNVTIGKNDVIGTGGVDVVGKDTNGNSSESAAITFSLSHSTFEGGFGLAPVRGGLISGNLTHDNGRGRLLGYATGINVLGAKGVLVSGNSSYNQGFNSTTGLGMHAGESAEEPGGVGTVCGDTRPTLPAVTLGRIAVLDNYVYDTNTTTPTMLNAFKGSSTFPVVVAGNTYAPTIGVSDDFFYLNSNSIKTDNDAQP